MRDAEMRDAEMRDAEMRDAEMRDAEMRDAEMRDAEMRAEVASREAEQDRLWRCYSLDHLIEFDLDANPLLKHILLRLASGEKLEED